MSCDQSNAISSADIPACDRSSAQSSQTRAGDQHYIQRCMNSLAPAHCGINEEKHVAVAWRKYFHAANRNISRTLVTDVPYKKIYNIWIN